MTPITKRGTRLGLRESWESYRARTGCSKLAWQAEGWRLLAWAGPGHPCPTSNGITPIEDGQGEARPAAS